MVIKRCPTVASANRWRIGRSLSSSFNAVKKIGPSFSTWLMQLAVQIQPKLESVKSVKKKKLGGQKLVKAVFSCRIEFPIAWKAEIGSPNRQNWSRASPSKKLVSKIFEIGAVTTKNGNVTWSKKIDSPNWQPKSPKLESVESVKKKIGLRNLLNWHSCYQKW